MREGTQEDFDHFCMYSRHVRYLGIIDNNRILSDEVLEDYLRLFPDRPFLPRVQSINTCTSPVQPMSPPQWLRFLLRSSTPAKNQPPASASTLKNLHISPNLPDDAGEGARLLALDLLAFQHSNVKLGGGLEVFKMVDRHSYIRHNTVAYQDIIENAFVMLPPGTVDSPARGLRHFELFHSLPDLPDFFGKVAKMSALEHLKIVILGGWDYGDDMLEVGDKMESIQHSLSSLEIEAFWWDLSPAINLCASPSATAQLRKFHLYYHEEERESTGASVTQVLDLPAGIIPPDHLETLTIAFVDDSPHTEYPYLEAEMLTTNVLQPLLQYRKMVKLHLDLPCSICLDIKFLHALAAVMGGTLNYLVLLRAITYWCDSSFKPVITVEHLSTIAGILFPRLETLGLEVPWRDTPSRAERDCYCTSPLLRTLHVGTKRTLFGQESSNVAIFLKDRFPGLQYLYRHRLGHDDDDGWWPILTTNGYRGGYHYRVLRY